MSHREDTIAAVATGAGGAISVIRVSGPEAIDVCEKLFKSGSGKPLSLSNGYTLHYGRIMAGDETVDDVIVSLFRAPRSYTGQDMVEISCHGSSYIKSRIMGLLTENGVRPADAGEFTLRAFMAGKMDLSQAEAVADIIASEDKASHSLAMKQMKGGYSSDLRQLREALVGLASLLELELDFSDEDVEFADRDRLVNTVHKVRSRISELGDSFLLNNAVKDGIPVTIAGEPNTGKSTLLNALVRHDRAMVSDIAGTTRDIIEESLVLDGIRFRFTDTAGLRTTDDRLENMGIERAYQSISKARVLLYVVSPDADGHYSTGDVLQKLKELNIDPDTAVIILLNKCDLAVESPKEPLIKKGYKDTLSISAKNGNGLDELKELLVGLIDREMIYGSDTVVTNYRHYEALLRCSESLQRAAEGLRSDIPSDLLAGDIRDALYHLGTITGEITNDEILGTIFSKFCIGK